MVEIIFALIWFFVGSILAVPYNYLAGGGLDNFGLTIFFAPAAAIFLFIPYLTIRIDHSKKSKIFFWATVVYLLLPILMNGVSLLLKQMGYVLAADYAFKYRYIVLATPFILWPCYVIIIDIFEGAKNLWQRVTTHPSNICK